MRLYAIVRRDLSMPIGKLAAQAGHAFTDTLTASRAKSFRRYAAYTRDQPGTKIVLYAENEEELRSIQHKVGNTVPTALIIDSGHVLLPHFDGSAVVTALGIGPCSKEEGAKFLGTLPLVR